MANREDSVALAHRRLGHKLYAVNDSVHLARKRLGIPEPPPAQQSASERDQLKKESPGVRGAGRQLSPARAPRRVAENIETVCKRGPAQTCAVGHRTGQGSQGCLLQIWQSRPSETCSCPSPLVHCAAGTRLEAALVFLFVRCR